MDRLAIVFIPLQENQAETGLQEARYSERLKTDQKISEDEHCNKLKEQINCNACFGNQLLPSILSLTFICASLLQIYLARATAGMNQPDFNGAIPNYSK